MAFDNIKKKLNGFEGVKSTFGNSVWSDNSSIDDFWEKQNSIDDATARLATVAILAEAPIRESKNYTPYIIVGALSVVLIYAAAKYIARNHLIRKITDSDPPSQHYGLHD